jgi:hypothetical protein
LSVDERLIDAYRATVWTVELDGARLEVRIGVPCPLDIALLPGYIITACNPGSVPTDPARNSAANSRLLARLTGIDAMVAPAVAREPGSDDDRWTEPGFLIGGVPRTTVVELAGEFGQNAIVGIGTDAVPELIITSNP